MGKKKGIGRNWGMRAKMAFYLLTENKEVKNW